MPYLFVAEKKGWRDEFNQPWEGIGEDYTELTPRTARIMLPFPESPLQHKNPELMEPAKEGTESYTRSPSPEIPRTPASYLREMTTRQVLVENTYEFNEAAQIHYQYTRFLITPRRDVAEKFQISPRFVRRQWSPNSAAQRPKWMQYKDHPHGQTSLSVHALESEVRNCDWYMTRPVNDDVAEDLLEWAFTVTPRSIRNVHPETLWPAQTPQDIEMAPVDTLGSPPQPSPEPERPPTPPPQLTADGRPVRVKRKTWKLLQQLPEPAPPVPPAPPAEEPVPDPASQPAENWVWKAIRTTVNSFGLFREYPAVPTYNPDEVLTVEELSDIPGGTRSNTATIPSQLTPFEPDDSLLPDTSPPPPPGSVPSSSSSTPAKPYTGPFANWSVMGLMTWQWTGSSTKSIEEAEKLLEILKDPKFSKEDIQDFDVKRETSKLDDHLSHAGTSNVRDGWKSVSVDIPIPDGKPHSSEADAPVFSVPGLFYRPLVEVIKSAVRDMGDRCFHYTPFKQFWTPSPGSPPQRIYDEIYSSDAMVEAHTALQNQPREPGCMLERVILSMMFWSDSTHLASFGDTSLWPLYLFFGNQSKWLRVKPRSNVCHHVAYFPKLPDAFHDFFKALTGDAPSADVLTHLYRPYIFTYSADYPEKVLLATIRNLGKAPCPRCYICKEDIHELGMVRDDNKRETLARTDEHIQNGTIRRIRDWIYKAGRNVKSTTFDFFLLARSWTPTSFKFNPFRMLIPDFMHEFELGVFKAFFIHLLRIFFAYGHGTISLLNERHGYLSVIPAALKKMAAWNYQAILLCALPVIEGLLPEPYNTEVLDVIFALAEWHSLAKLKMHTDTTIDLLRSATKEVGRLLRRFRRVVCPWLPTKELPSEEATRGRAQARKAAKGKGKGRTKTQMTPRTKEFSLWTYKLHSLGDYVRSILWFGTTDSYSTQPGELEHRRVKRFYARTNKNRAVRQISVLERRETSLLRIAARAKLNARLFGKTTATPDPQGHKKKLKNKTYIPFAESEALPYTTPEQHHHISGSHNYSLPLSSWIFENRFDPAVKDFVPKLQEHLLSRIVHPEWTGDGNEFTSQERFQLSLKNQRMYRHKILRVNYTSYDVRRGQDCLNPRTHSDVMTLAPEGDTSHPFSYAQIIGIFHADVVHTANGADPTPRSMQFLWVRRYRLDPTWRGGFNRKRLFRIEFLPESDPNAFGFLNPDEVIRGAHIIPAFAYGKTSDHLSAGSLGRLPRKGLAEDEDWRFYYVNFFVDRDMYMRYRGGGVGHYQVTIPPEDATPVTHSDDEDVQPESPTLAPEVTPAPLNTPPRTPEAAPILLPDRPDSSLSQNSEGLHSAASNNTSDESDLEQNNKEDSDESDYLGPDDGEGDVDDEVDEGYTPL
ncbi:hypothetical protein C8R43DRAFT_1128654 [Mycena crocata]|nr:hypothetical protein C8R43DRAFT_1128654 [Mycena crocata]